jgi:hypothetical protein
MTSSHGSASPAKSASASCLRSSQHQSCELNSVSTRRSWRVAAVLQRGLAVSCTAGAVSSQTATLCRLLPAACAGVVVQQLTQQQVCGFSMCCCSCLYISASLDCFTCHGCSGLSRHCSGYIVACTSLMLQQC